MLILSRKIGQRIIIDLPTGETIALVVLDAHSTRRDPCDGSLVSHGRARIGFTAPANVLINREEIRNPPEKRDATPGH